MGNYTNIFTAISTELDVFPHTNYQATPYSDTQTAIVIENTDPNGMARIKVQFPWQKFMGITPLGSAHLKSKTLFSLKTG